MIVHDEGSLCFAVAFKSEKFVYRGCQSTAKPEATEGVASRTGHSRLNLNSHKYQIVVSNVTEYLLTRTLII